MKKGKKKVKPLVRMMGAGIMGVAMFVSSLSVFAYDTKSVAFFEEAGGEIYFWEDEYNTNSDLQQPLSPGGKVESTIIGRQVSHTPLRTTFYVPVLHSLRPAKADDYLQCEPFFGKCVSVPSRSFIKSQK